MHRSAATQKIKNHGRLKFSEKKLFLTDEDSSILFLVLVRLSNKGDYFIFILLLATLSLIVFNKDNKWLSFRSR